MTRRLAERCCQSGNLLIDQAFDLVEPVHRAPDRRVAVWRFDPEQAQEQAQAQAQTAEFGPQQRRWLVHPRCANGGSACECRGTTAPCPRPSRGLHHHWPATHCEARPVLLAHRHQGLRQGDGLGAHADRERGLVKAMRQEVAGLPAKRVGVRPACGNRSRSTPPRSRRSSDSSVRRALAPAQRRPCQTR